VILRELDDLEVGAVWVICDQLVDALGGSVTVGSTVGVGATFTIRLPAWD
jgi:signal transduction histidine kinase